jgi:hypothetical protein
VKWKKSTPEARLFLPREEEADGMKKIKERKAGDKRS